jgi:hypothetical protein
MPDDPITIEPTGPHVIEPVAPEVVSPGKEHLGLLCVSCGKPFSLIGPLDPEKVPPDRSLSIRARRSVLHATCGQCGHKADYPLEQLLRLSLS